MIPQLEISSAVKSKSRRKTPSLLSFISFIFHFTPKLTCEFLLKFLKSATEDWPMLFAPAEVVPVVPVVPPGGLHPPPDHFLQLNDLASAVAAMERSSSSYRVSGTYFVHFSSHKRAEPHSQIEILYLPV